MLWCVRMCDVEGRLSFVKLSAENGVESKTCFRRDPWRDELQLCRIRFSPPPGGTKNTASNPAAAIHAPWKGCWVEFKLQSRSPPVEDHLIKFLSIRFSNLPSRPWHDQRGHVRVRSSSCLVARRELHPTVLLFFTPRRGCYARIPYGLQNVAVLLLFMWACVA